MIERVVINTESYDFSFLPFDKPLGIEFIGINLENGLPSQIWNHKNIEYLKIISCNYHHIESQLVNFPLSEIDLNDNKIREFPYFLLQIPILEKICLDNNYIRELSDDYDYRNVIISLKGQHIRKIPKRAGVFIKTSADYADISTAISENYDFGPNEDWKIANSLNVSEHKNATHYTYKGDRILNSCLRLPENIILPQILPLYEDLCNLRDQNIPIPKRTLLFRGIKIF